ncbi:MAG TPA: hypothetical protein VN765_00660 [Candidatus Acidoferrum sp.]|nr:hypothetical protein [Candidatus Acidoferrum sp.]
MLLRICLIIAILGGGGVVAVNFVMVKKALETTVTQRDDEKKAKVAAQTELASTKTKLDTTTKNLANTTAKLTQTQGQLNTANGKVAELETQNKDLTTKFNDAASKRDQFQAELAKFEQLNVTPAEVIQLRADLKKITAALAGVNTENKVLLAKVEDLQRELDRLRPNSEIVVEPPGLRGSVVAVDPKYDFVVLNIGKDKGVLPDGIMMIARAGVLIGKVQIARVDNTQCIANILPAWRRGDVMEGDQVLD